MEIEEYPKTGMEVVKKFDKGEKVTVVNVSGFGGGYELAIWTAIFRMIKAYHKEDMDKWLDKKGEFKNVKGDYWNIADEKLSKVAEDMGLSGAQAGKVKSISWRVMKDGWRETIKTAPKKQLIKIKRCRDL